MRPQVQEESVQAHPQAHGAANAQDHPPSPPRELRHDQLGKNENYLNDLLKELDIRLN